MHDETDTDAKALLDILDSANLKQLIDFPTHRQGNTLDLVITNMESELVDDLKPDYALRGASEDHIAISCKLNVTRPAATKKTLLLRKFKDLNVNAFCEDIKASSLVTTPADTVDGLVKQYNATLTEQLLIYMRQKDQRPSPSDHTHPGTYDSLRDAKRAKRQLERRMLKSGLTVDKQAFKEQCKQYHSMLDNAKTEHHRSEIAECN